jgi:hypothetical protein
VLLDRWIAAEDSTGSAEAADTSAVRGAC